MRENVELVSPDKLKDVLIYRTAIKTLKSQDLVEKIIAHQYKSARDAFKKYAEVEVSGFGKFIISKAKIRRKIGRVLESIEEVEGRLHYPLPEWRQRQYNTRLTALTEQLEYLKTKER